MSVTRFGAFHHNSRFARNWIAAHDLGAWRDESALSLKCLGSRRVGRVLLRILLLLCTTSVILVHKTIVSGGVAF